MADRARCSWELPSGRARARHSITTKCSERRAFTSLPLGERSRVGTSQIKQQGASVSTKKDNSTSGAQVDRRRFLGVSRCRPQSSPGAGARGAASAEPTATATSAESQPATAQELAGKVAYVTGASSGIGLATARRPARAGMKVALGYIMDDQIKEAMTHFKADDPMCSPSSTTCSIGRAGKKRRMPSTSAGAGRTCWSTTRASVSTRAPPLPP